MKEIISLIIIFVMIGVTTYGFSRGIWLLGFRKRCKSFNILWLAVSCLFTHIAAAVGLVLLVWK